MLMQAHIDILVPHCSEVSQQNVALGQKRPICARDATSASPSKATRLLHRAEGHDGAMADVTGLTRLTSRTNFIPMP